MAFCDGLFERLKFRVLRGLGGFFRCRGGGDADFRLGLFLGFCRGGRGLFELLRRFGRQEFGRFRGLFLGLLKSCGLPARSSWPRAGLSARGGLPGALELLFLGERRGRRLFFQASAGRFLGA